MNENILASSPTPMTPAQRYRKSDKCKIARERYYESKGRSKAHEYYEKNREKILERSKNRYLTMKALAESQAQE